MPAFDFEIVYLARHGETEWNREAGLIRRLLKRGGTKLSDSPDS